MTADFTEAVLWLFSTIFEQSLAVALVIAAWLALYRIVADW